MAEEKLSMEQISDEAQRKEKMGEKMDVFIRGQQQAHGIMVDGLILKISTQPGEDTQHLSSSQPILLPCQAQ